MTTRLMLTVAMLSSLTSLASVLAHFTPSRRLLSCPSGARAMARLELVFGSKRIDDVAVTEKEWRSFLDGEVTPRFPSGLTVLSGPGQWRDKLGHLVREGAQILVIWHDPSQEADKSIEAIRAAYKSRFLQESVMRVDSASCVSF